MMTLSPFLLLLIAAVVIGNASEGEVKNEFEERLKDEFKDPSRSEVAEVILLRELEVLEETLFGKEMTSDTEENRNSREKRCMGYDIECNENLPCCKHRKLECVETSGYWWYKRKYCRPIKG
uniref:Mu-hexatoxin-Mg1a n=1 Tax=Macrothele gigas TaxID=223896 RepID=TXMG2_MACGS|nr:RecName: Full=Mu-hexatoxin-Mg1a; Short=Mu-HXTX-Mg1a; AltName: Full=Neurotoxin magi-2; Flags: Precursor [Macrothele gigas]BAD13409.1 Magi 2 [Macrothele gigas]